VERQPSIQQEIPPPRRWRHVAGHDLGAIFLGGSIGSILRSALAHSFGVSVGQWPWPTFVVNIIGAALIGYLIVHTQERRTPSLYGRSFVGIGLCGALTTFSTMIAELLAMLEASRFGLAASYGAASIAGGLLAVALTSRLARRVVSPS
jgi:fluoride exporter